MYQIIWSNPAKEDYWQNIDYLIENWHEKQVTGFIDTVSEYLNTISDNPKSFPLTGYRNVRSVPIVKQITLFYRIANEDTIELIRFWNNYQDPDKLRF